MAGTQSVAKRISRIPENQLIFASKLYEEQFRGEMTEGAYYQALGRMCKAGSLCRIGRGTYYRPKRGKYGPLPLPQAEVLSVFTTDGAGTIVGYTMYHQLKLTTQIPKTITVLTSRLEQQTKQLGDVSLRFCNLNYTPKVKNSLHMLEVLQNFETIQELNYPQFLRLCEAFSAQYQEEVIRQILAQRSYKKRTLSFLKNVLDYYRVPNHVGNDLSPLSKYRHLTMEAIYEAAQLS